MGPSMSHCIGTWNDQGQASELSAAQAETMRRVLSMLPKERAVLDASSGWGTLAGYMRSLGDSRSLFALADTQVQRQWLDMKRLPSVTSEMGDLTTYFGRETFGGLVLFAALPSILDQGMTWRPGGSVRDILPACIPLVAPGGRVIIETLIEPPCLENITQWLARGYAPASSVMRSDTRFAFELLEVDDVTGDYRRTCRTLAQQLSVNRVELISVAGPSRVQACERMFSEFESRAASEQTTAVRAVLSVAD